MLPNSSLTKHQGLCYPILRWQSIQGLCYPILVDKKILRFVRYNFYMLCYHFLKTHSHGCNQSSIFIDKKKYRTVDNVRRWVRLCVNTGDLSGDVQSWFVIFEVCLRVFFGEYTLCPGDFVHFRTLLLSFWHIILSDLELSLWKIEFFSLNLFSLLLLLFNLILI